MTTDITKELAEALDRYERAVDAVNATAAADDPHASVLAVNERDRAAEVLKTWSQPEYLRTLVDALASYHSQGDGKPECKYMALEGKRCRKCQRIHGQDDSNASAFSNGFAAGLEQGWQPPFRDTAALHDVVAERQRQISVEGWTPEHDDEHSDGEMALAASCYACAGANLDDAARDWPWDDSWFKPGDQRRNLVKAGALILAEIERLDRAAPSTTSPNEGVRPQQTERHWSLDDDEAVQALMDRDLEG